MKIIFSILMLIPLAVFSQVTLRNISLSDTSKKILRIGRENRIQVVNVRQNKLIFMVSGGGAIIKKLRWDLYDVRVTKRSITIIQVMSSKGKILTAEKFQIEPATMAKNLTSDGPGLIGH